MICSICGRIGQMQVRDGDKQQWCCPNGHIWWHYETDHKSPPKPKWKIAVVGSREFPRLDWVRDFIKRLPDGTIVVSGGARGVDRTAEEAARQRGLQVEVHQPDWQRHGRTAGVIRNGQMVASADAVVAFWDGRSRGTAHSIAAALQAGKSVQVFVLADRF